MRSGSENDEIEMIFPFFPFFSAELWQLIINKKGKRRKTYPIAEQSRTAAAGVRKWGKTLSNLTFALFAAAIFVVSAKRYIIFLGRHHHWL